MFLACSEALPLRCVNGSLQQQLLQTVQLQCYNTCVHIAIPAIVNAADDVHPNR